MRKRILWGDRGFMVDAEAPGQPQFWDGAPNGWEPDLFNAINRYVTKHTRVIDIGAWIGPVTLYCAAGKSSVYAIEPDPVAHRILQRNVAMNEFAPKPHVMECALAFEDGPLRIGAMRELGDSQTSIYGMKQRLEVSAYRLESLVELHDIQPPYFIKIDTEGAETQIISGSFEWLMSRHPTLHLSVHPQILPTGITYNWTPIDALASRYLYVYDHEGERWHTPSKHPVPVSFLFAQEPLKL